MQGMSCPCYDAHNHLQDDWLVPHRARILEQCGGVNLRAMVSNGTSENDWPALAQLAALSELIVPCFGLHPWYVGNRSSDWEHVLRAFLVSHPCAPVGEIGLDRWMLERARPDDARLEGLRRAPMEEQRKIFESQLSLAKELGRSACIHCLDAWGPLLEILKESALPPQGFLLHAYAGPSEMVAAFADLGAYFSFNGSFLDPRRRRAREAYRCVPADRLLVETDAPAMLPPNPWAPYALPPGPGGQALNHPCNAAPIGAGLASFLGIDHEQLAMSCEANFLRLFRASASQLSAAQCVAKR